MRGSHPFDTPAESEEYIRRCGVEVSFDTDGTPYSAVVRTQLHKADMDMSWETKIVFVISDGVAYFSGFTEPDQASVPHFKTIPAACEQIANIAGVQDVESPEETLGRLLTTGRELPRADQQA